MSNLKQIKLSGITDKSYLKLNNQGSPTFRATQQQCFFVIFPRGRSCFCYAVNKTIGHNDRNKRIFSSFFIGLKATYFLDIFKCSFWSSLEFYSCKSFLPQAMVMTFRKPLIDVNTEVSSALLELYQGHTSLLVYCFTALHYIISQSKS